MAGADKTQPRRLSPQLRSGDDGNVPHARSANPGAFAQVRRFAPSSNLDAKTGLSPNRLILYPILLCARGIVGFCYKFRTGLGRAAVLEGAAAPVLPETSIIVFVARGWESKSVEQQQDEAASSPNPKNLLTPKQSVEQRKRQGLMLSRQRVLQQLQAAQNPRHRDMLRAALADLDAQLSRLG